MPSRRGSAGEPVWAYAERRGTSGRRLAGTLFVESLSDRFHHKSLQAVSAHSDFPFAVVVTALQAQPGRATTTGELSRRGHSALRAQG